MVQDLLFWVWSRFQKMEATCDPSLSVLDRRISISMGAERSLYKVLREWVEDDPTRTAVSFLSN